jgi:hypothetical protein
MRKEPHTLSCKVTIADFDKAVKQAEKEGFTYMGEFVYDKIFAKPEKPNYWPIAVCSAVSVGLAFCITLI